MMRGWRLALALVAALTTTAPACRSGLASPEQLRQQVRALEREREVLRKKVDALMVDDLRLEGMPRTALRLGVPTTLARELVEKIMGAFVDQMEIVLTDLHARKTGRLKRVVTLGEYDLDVAIDELRGRLKTGKPELRFGGDQVSVAVQVSLASGSGRATIRFRWAGKGVGGAVCGDLDITREVSGGLKPDRYPVQGSLVLSATEHRMLATPRFPKLEIRLRIEPSAESWASLQAILDEKSGVCGFVLDKVDVLEFVRDLVDKGFAVTLPTEKLKAMELPVGIEPTLSVRGTSTDLTIKLGGLAITEHFLWLGADVQVAAPDAASQAPK
jgi:hypothetical protein